MGCVGCELHAEMVLVSPPLGSGTALSAACTEIAPPARPSLLSILPAEPKKSLSFKHAEAYHHDKLAEISSNLQ